MNENYRWARRAAGVLVLALVALGPAAAMERGPYSMEVLVDGRPLSEYPTRSATYVEALEGREYSLQVTNHTGRRIAVALSVDGLNSIDARSTTARAAAKWILGPYETITVDGWQTGASTARRFFFTTEDRSYGAWLGDTRNLGIVSAAVFREKVREPEPIHRPRRDRPSTPSERRKSGREAPAPSGKLEGNAGAGADAEVRTQEKAGEQELSDDLAATGIGREVEHRVHRVRFEAESSPAAVMELRYEYHDALARLGVLPPAWAYREDPLTRRERARGFEGFAPDPWSRY